MDLVTSRDRSLEQAVGELLVRCTRSGDCLMVPVKGYGEVRYASERMGAHRAVYTVAHGPIPEGLVVRHACDRAGCVEISHLSLGTAADNRRDASERDRLRTGEDHPNVTVPAAVVAQAVSEYLAGGQSQAAVARKYGVQQTTLGHWVRAESRRDGGQTGFVQGKGRRRLARPVLPCGTKAAYERHHVEGTPVCSDCREAHRAYMRAYKAHRRTRATTDPTPT